MIELKQIIEDQKKALGDSIKEGIIDVKWIVETIKPDVLLKEIDFDIIEEFVKDTYKTTRNS